MYILRVAAFATVFLFAALGAVWAEDITLTSRDGSVEISGTLVGYDGEFYRVETEYGVLTVDGSGVICDGPACPNLSAYVAEFAISGTRTMGAVLLPALIEGFARRQGYALKREEMPGFGLAYTFYDDGGKRLSARITIRLTGSDEGFEDLLAQRADMVLSLREATAQERGMAQTAGLGDLNTPRQSRVVALDGLVPVVARENPVRRISMQQLADVYSGEITNWSALGGEDAPITLHMRDPGRGLGQAFIRQVFAQENPALSDAVIAHPTNDAMIDAVSDDPFGIGIASHSQRGFTQSLTLSGTCGFELAASPLTIKAEDYPLTVPMYLYLPARKLPRLAREFLSYLRSDAAQRVITRAGFVDLAPGEIALRDQGDRLANAIRAAGEEVGLSDLQRMITMFEGARRLSVTFRFDGGATGLNASSRSNVTLLARALASGGFDGRRLTFVGFSDGKGAAAVNQRLARERAQAVRTAVAEAAATFGAGEMDLNADAFGEALPMACDDSTWGRGVNRRVEVWIR